MHSYFYSYDPIEYLQLFPLLRTWGATGLLLEWEDTFPYNRELSPIGSNGPSSLASGYTIQEAGHILQIAGDCGLAVVPLVQTFGHMEVCKRYLLFILIDLFCVKLIITCNY